MSARWAGKAVRSLYTPRSKYGAVKTSVDGMTFASKAESRRYAELLLLGRAGSIRNLELQPSWPVRINGVQVCVYRADFRYEELTETGGRWDDTIEDVKGMKTPVYRLKKKLVEALYGIEIREITRC